MSHNRFTPERREEIAQAIRDHAGLKSASALAKQLGCSKTSVTTIAAEIGMADVFDRSKTANATAAKQQDNRARRAQLMEDHLSDAVRIRERLWEPAQVITPLGERAELPLPPARDVRDFMTSVQSAMKISMELERHDASKGNADAAVSVIGDLMDALRGEYRKDQAADAGDDS
jgi:hypothetical protein